MLQVEDVRNDRQMSSSETLKAANRKLSAEWDLLPPEAKSIYKEKARQFYAAEMEEVQQAWQTADLTSSRAAASNRRPAYHRISS